MDNFKNRLNTAMELREKTAAQLSRETGLSKARLSQYINGVYEAKQIALYKLSVALNVSEAWLMGYDVPMERNETPRKESELDRELKQWLSNASDDEKIALLNLLKSINNK